MRFTICFATMMLSTIASPAAGAAANAEPDERDSSRQIKRVGGDLDAQVTRNGEQFHCGTSVVKTSLPAGYPAPTPPGAIDLKRYPSVRRAEVSGQRDPNQGRNGAFLGLFRHIQRRDIAMTAPVEMDYPGWSGDKSLAPQAWTMSFLYRSPDAGPIEQSGDVRVVDTTPLTVVSVGLRGKYGRTIEDRGLQQLSAWLDEQDEWVRAGDPRALYYNGPSIRDSRKWVEVQIPVGRSGAVIAPARNEPSRSASSAGQEVGGILADTLSDGCGDARSALDKTPETG
jgi:hypothetical protein